MNILLYDKIKDINLHDENVLSIIHKEIPDISFSIEDLQLLKKIIQYYNKNTLSELNEKLQSVISSTSSFIKVSDNKSKWISYIITNSNMITNLESPNIIIHTDKLKIKIIKYNYINLNLDAQRSITEAKRKKKLPLDEIGNKLLTDPDDIIGKINNVINKFVEILNSKLIVNQGTSKDKNYGYYRRFNDQYYDFKMKKNNYYWPNFGITNITPKEALTDNGCFKGVISNNDNINTDDIRILIHNVNGIVDHNYNINIVKGLFIYTIFNQIKPFTCLDDNINTINTIINRTIQNTSYLNNFNKILVINQKLRHYTFDIFNNINDSTYTNFQDINSILDTESKYIKFKNSINNLWAIHHNILTLIINYLGFNYYQSEDIDGTLNKFSSSSSSTSTQKKIIFRLFDKLQIITNAYISNSELIKNIEDILNSYYVKYIPIPDMLNDKHYYIYQNKYQELYNSIISKYNKS